MEVTVTRRELQLINLDKNQKKFYTLYVSDRGHVLFHWGRIGTKGQWKTEAVPPSEVDEYAQKQMHLKMSKGYRRMGEDVFTARAGDFKDPYYLESALRNHRAKHGVKEAEQETMAELTAFADQANKLLTSIARPSSKGEAAEHIEEYLSLKSSWKEIQSRVETIAAVMELIDGHMEMNQGLAFASP